MNIQDLNTAKNKSEIGQMFDSISGRYDFLNHLLSFGIDRYWRRRAIEIIGQSLAKPRILDVATGTGDLAMAALKLDPVKVTGIDISEEMLELGRKKIGAKNLANVIDFIRCDSENICFEDNTFDAAMAGFGVRNFSDPVKGLSEMRRVIRKNGLVVVLEFSKPDGFIFKHIYNLYFRHLLPFLGAVLSGHAKAYKYLNQSVMDFADKEEFVMMMEKAGLSDIKQTRMTRGIASVYTGVKK